jgi:hypothetical protein
MMMLKWRSYNLAAYTKNNIIILGRLLSLRTLFELLRDSVSDIREAQPFAVWIELTSEEKREDRRNEEEPSLRQLIANSDDET